MTSLNRNRDPHKNTPEQSARIVEQIREQEQEEAYREVQKRLKGAPKPPEIVVPLMGGIGNQLFQYAFGVSLASIHKKTVGFSNYKCQNDRWRPGGYQLDAFVTDIKLVPKDLRPEPIIDEGAFHFQPDIRGPNVGTYVGYWQTEKYFDVDLVREKVAYRYPLSDESLRVAELILAAGPGSTFLHIRHGADYKRSDFHALQNMIYYREAILRIRQTHAKPKFFLFGDDPDFIRANFIGDDFIVVDHIKPDTNAVHEDMQLMSLCHNGAIANSSFSWWAAWLGNIRLDQQIFAPKQWFGSGYQQNLDMRDVVPDRWTVLG